MGFYYYNQLNEMDCGPTCLRMVAKHYGKHYNSDTLREKTGFSKQGVSLLGISETAEKLGFRTRGVQITYKKLQTAPLPAILHWNQNHFVVLVEIKKKSAVVADPGKGIISYTPKEFEQYWNSNKNESIETVGTALLMEPTSAFYESEDEKQNKLSWASIFQYLKFNKFRISQIFLSLIAGMILQLFLPFLTQSMVDTGINTRDLDFITIVLVAQLFLTLSSTIIGFIRNRIQLRVSNAINISILSDFWMKLTRLPISYFEKHNTGDIIQRIRDNTQVQSFLTGQAITTIFSLINFIVYSIILIIFSLQLFIVFTLGNLLYYGWIRLFLHIRRKINYQNFHISAKENNATLQLVQGMQEIRLNGAEKLKRWEWENIQAQVFNLNYKNLNYSQWQTAGALLINQGKDITITFLVAKLVINGDLSFGTMLAVQYIIGSLSGPIQDFISLVQSFQDTKISMERLNEVHNLEDEEPGERSFVSHLPEDNTINFKKLSFAYPGAGNDPVLDQIDLRIESGKVTAIVGVSGSGKTTLLKLLLRIYEQYNGDIDIGTTNLKFISPTFWRNQCGAVLQDGYIFNDTIGRNIAVGELYIDNEKLLQSCKTANLLDYIEKLPNGFHTKLGADGVGISQGQKQRLLIARAIYKNPKFLFFDEATNSLDANNERTIVENLAKFFKGRTVVVVAHRLSTVRHADNIIVLHQGKIVEQGTHEYLTTARGRYYELVKNQLELGN